MDDEFWMQQALELAREAEAQDEVPVGAIIVYQDQIIGRGSNQPIKLQDPTAHAEIIALRAAARHLKNYRLPDVTLYVTLEPCAMCAVAMIHARIARLVFAALDPKTGAAGSVFNLVANSALNHQINCTSGILAEQSTTLLQTFFRAKR